MTDELARAVPAQKLESAVSPRSKGIDDWNLFDDAAAAKFNSFRLHSQNVFGIRRWIINPEQMIANAGRGRVGDFMVLGPNGIEDAPNKPMYMQIVLGGTPHRHRGFGFWHINDKDELYLPLPAEAKSEPGHFVIMMQMATGTESERYGWYCIECSTMLFEREYEIAEEGLDGFWDAMLLAVRAFNSDINNRTCPECGAVHPPAFGWNPALDTTEEREARGTW